MKGDPRRGRKFLRGARDISLFGVGVGYVCGVGVWVGGVGVWVPVGVYVNECMDGCVSVVVWNIFCETSYDLTVFRHTVRLYTAKQIRCQTFNSVIVLKKRVVENCKNTATSERREHTLIVGLPKKKIFIPLDCLEGHQTHKLQTH